MHQEENSIITLQKDFYNNVAKIEKKKKLFEIFVV